MKEILAPPLSMARRPSGANAIALMCCAMLLLPIGDAFAKAAAQDTAYSGIAIAWARFVTGLALIAPYVLVAGALRGLGRGFYAAQLLRGALLACAIAMIITGASTAPLADVYGAFFVAPFVATLWAAAVLKERVRRLEWAALGVGFIGVLLVVQPSGAADPGLLWACGAGCCFGTFLAATRWAAGSGPPLAQLGGQLFVGSVLLAPFAVSDFVSEGVEAPWLLLGSGVASAAANLLSIMALRSANAAALAPLIYLQLASATVVGWAFFSDAPDLLAALGLCVIGLSGLGRLFMGRAR